MGKLIFAPKHRGRRRGGHCCRTLIALFDVPKMFQVQRPMFPHVFQAKRSPEGQLHKLDQRSGSAAKNGKRSRRFHLALLYLGNMIEERQRKREKVDNTISETPTFTYSIFICVDKDIIFPPPDTPFHSLYPRRGLDK